MQRLGRAWQGASRCTPRPTWKHALVALMPIAALLWNGYNSYTIRGLHTESPTPPPMAEGVPSNQQAQGGSGESAPPLPAAATGADSAAPRGPGIVRLNFMGRLGNNLFEYAAARTLADGLGWALSVQPARYNRRKFGLLTRPEGMACFPGIRPLGPPGSSAEMAGLKTTTFRGMRQELQDPTPRSIVMEGWFQEYGMFSSEKERLREIMALNPSCCGPTAPGPKDLVIHYRNYRAELTPEQYKTLLFKDLDFEFYEAVLRDAAASDAGPPETVWVVGEFKDDEAFFQRLQQAHPGSVKKAEMVEDQFHAFCFLTRASRLVMAQSTFSWWVAFLGNAMEIHFPLANKGVTGPKVAVDEERYVYRDEAGRVVAPP